MNEARILPELQPEDFDQYSGQVIEPQRRRLQPYQWAEFRGQQRREYLVKGEALDTPPAASQHPISSRKCRKLHLQRSIFGQFSHGGMRATL